MTDEEHNKYIAWAFLANGSFQILMLLFIFLFIFAIFAGAPPGGDFPAGFLALIFGFAFLINLIFLSPNFIAGYAILKRKPWARIAGIVAAVFSAMNIPFGTAAAAYSLWFFCGEQWRTVYPQEPAGQPQIAYGAESKWDGRVMNEEGEIVYRNPQPPDWR